MTLLSVQDLVKHFPVSGSSKLVKALNGVTFEIERGETFSLVGESGSGKTTVGRAVVGLIEATSGAIVFDGKPMSWKRNIRSPELRGRIQFVFQEPGESFNPREPVAAAMIEPLKYLGMNRSDRDRRLAEVLELIRMPMATAMKLPDDLSPGMLQRAAVGRAIITRPDLVVLDEPTSALDPTARAEIVDLLISVQKKMETAYLFISHDLSTVRFLTDRICVMYLGSVMETGPAEKVFLDPRHPYSVGLMASVLLPHPSLKTPERMKLEGEIPSPLDLPPGCPLASRCPLVEPACRERMPLPEYPQPKHLVHCINHHKLERADVVSDRFETFHTLSDRILRQGLPERVA
ncbi:ABC transporter ATP-binding protein [Allosediminivita pacifica]|uniref:Peptide/nickel transport system ATP-binding protein n=1 Tax=Allosediminivita pacifica TaxID=1267769 RepID=A0A2T6ATS8_9RHOB|nr:ABC transporter ATP-binding protein [Allosediminivita pacifica]PTX47228.1 peptide/nickel transport system ATP-binding protein [Allosediminivita pacifica]GGB09265.1 ABC transporter ATP-binding protein [Allosediminivita pacifica]